MNKEVITSYPIKCIGAPPSDLQTSIKKVALDPDDVSLTIYKDGSREVGCSLLSIGICERVGKNRENNRCIHLFPEESTK